MIKSLLLVNYPYAFRFWKAIKYFIWKNIFNNQVPKLNKLKN